MDQTADLEANALQVAAVKGSMQLLVVGLSRAVHHPAHAADRTRKVGLRGVRTWLTA